MDHAPLGKPTEYRFDYDASLLHPIARADGRQALQLTGALPFDGVDLWTAYELSWLDQHGKPQVAIAEFVFPCRSDNLIESKSLKLYLNGFNQTRFACVDAVCSTLVQDLSAACGAAVTVQLYPAAGGLPVAEAGGYTLLDTLDVSCDRYEVDAGLLSTGSEVITARWCSHLFRSLCPVTGQPDWASIYIDYLGPAPDPAGLLRYLTSFRQHQGFHEQCVEQIFVDMLRVCRPQQLTVSARFLRRGGLDINPLRSNCGVVTLPGRSCRQ